MFDNNNNDTGLFGQQMMRKNMGAPEPPMGGNPMPRPDGGPFWKRSGGTGGFDPVGPNGGLGGPQPVDIPNGSGAGGPMPRPDGGPHWRNTGFTGGWNPYHGPSTTPFVDRPQNLGEPMDTIPTENPINLGYDPNAQNDMAGLASRGYYRDENNNWHQRQGGPLRPRFDASSGPMPPMRDPRNFTPPPPMRDPRNFTPPPPMRDPRNFTPPPPMANPGTLFQSPMAPPMDPRLLNYLKFRG